MLVNIVGNRFFHNPKQANKYSEAMAIVMREYQADHISRGEAEMLEKYLARYFACKDSF